ncbi:MAG: hypothetical protein ABI850_18250 [Flavobacterium sp.]
MKKNKKELRDEFEKELQIYLKRELSDMPELKVTKNKISITHKKSGASAKIIFGYLANSNTYEIMIFIEHPELQQKISHITPPYPSNLLNPNFIYSMSTVSEKDACPLLPVTEKGVTNTCQLILSRIKNNYIPIIFNLFKITPELIDDVINRPKYYSYPFLLIFISMKNNCMTPDKVTIIKILSEETLGYSNDKQLKSDFNKQLLLK